MYFLALTFMFCLSLGLGPGPVRHVMPGQQMPMMGPPPMGPMTGHMPGPMTVMAPPGPMPPNMMMPGMFSFLLYIYAYINTIGETRMQGGHTPRMAKAHPRGKYYTH